ncbi:MAG: autotransporter domain-containing protein [Candidatus Spyradosoma sp.]
MKISSGLSFAALFVAATGAFLRAEEEPRETYDVSAESDLRKYLSETHSVETGETDEEGNPVTKDVYYDNADLSLTEGFGVDTTKTESETTTDDEGNEITTTTVTATGGIGVKATGSKILGNGRTISSTAHELGVEGSGDLFFLSGVTLSVENLTIAGTADAAKKTGRAFATGNVSSSVLNVGAGTTIENRRLVADGYTNYRASGGAIVSAHIMDEIRLTSGADGADVVFSGNVAVGNVVAYADSEGEAQTETLGATGGAIFASGLLSVSGAGTTVFRDNRAESEAATASGGAVFVSNAKLNADGSSSSTKYPDNVVDETGTKKFGLQVADTKLRFDGNSARGLNAQGGAVGVSGGYFDATGTAEIGFLGNAVRNLDRDSATEASQLGGGALLVCDGGRATFAETATVNFSGNEAVGESPLTVASGGAVAVSSAELSLAGETAFASNAVRSDKAGATLQGGALYVYGALENGTDADGAATKEHTANVTLAGRLSFTGNRVEASGLACTVPAESEGEGEGEEGGEGGETPSARASDEAETTQSSATGGALALNGGKIDGAALGSLDFWSNSVSAKTTAQGGALASISDVTDATFDSGKLFFNENSATLLALGADEAQTDGVVPVARGGAIYLAGGTLKLSAADADGAAFSKNTADASAQAEALALGGAIFQSAGTLALGATKFSGNVASARVAQGGAVFSEGGEQKFTGAAVFSGNAANAGTAASASGTTFARGGAIFLAQGATQNFSGATNFENNAAAATCAAGTGENGRRSGTAGGAIYSAGTLAFAAETTTAFSGNAAETSGDGNGAAFGGALYVESGKVSAGNFEMTGNRAAASGDAQGGALYVSSAGSLTLSGDFSLKGNSATSDARASGGAAYSSGTVRVGGRFSATNNTAEADVETRGGAIFLESGAFLISGDAEHGISGNRAVAATGNVFGGALCATGTFSQTAGTLNLSDNAATATAGNAFGGAIYARGGNVTLTGATIQGNSATATAGNAFGGAIYLDVSSRAETTLTLRGNTTISRNTANGASDGIFVGKGAGAEAKSSATLIFEQNATLIRDDDGNVTGRENVESATVSDKITARGATLAIVKKGDGDLTLGDVVALDGADAAGEPVSAEISLEIAGGNATLAGEVSALEKLSVASGATLNVASDFGGCASAEIAGTLNVGSGASFAFGAETKLTGALSLDGVNAGVSGAAVVSGSGTFSVKNSTTFTFSNDGETAGSLEVANLSLGAGTLRLAGAGTLGVADTLTFTESGATIEIDEDATLALKKVAHSAEVEGAVISGSGTLVLYGEAEESGYIDFSEFYETVTDDEGNETKELRAGIFSVGAGVKVRSGISVGEGVTLSLAVGSQEEGARNFRLSGGTLLAVGSNEGNPLKLESLSVSGKSVLGEAGEYQYFEMVAADEPPSEGGEAPDAGTTFSEGEGSGEGGTGSGASNANPISISGTLDVTETTTLVGDASLSGSGAELAGAGTLVGDVSGTGTVSIADVVGNLNANGSTRVKMTLAGTVRVTGDVNVGSAGTSSNHEFVFSEGASLLLLDGKFYNNGTTTVAGNASAGAPNFTGNFVNAGTLVVAADTTFVLDAGSTFRNDSDGVAGTIDLSASGSAIDFGNVVDQTTNVSLSGGRVLVDATKLHKGDPLGLLGVHDESILQDLRIEDVNDYSVASRFVWDSATGALIFRGLNGEAFRGTIFGDAQREGVNRTHEFLRSVQLRAGTRLLTPLIYGENKLQSPYMRGYLEKLAQRGGEVSAELEARRRRESELAQKLNSRSFNAWAQGDFSFREQRERGGAVAYDSTVAGALVGASVPVGSWEFGLAVASGVEKYETKDVSERHKIETDAYGLSAYGIYKNEWFDWSFGLSGAYASSESERGIYSGDFDAWRFGARTEVGATLRSHNRFALRAFAGLSAAYSRAGSFGETGAGENALDFDSDGAFGVRSDLGLSAAFLATDALQFSVRAAWLMDFGNDTYSLDARMAGTDTDYVVESRENEPSALEAGAYLHWAFTDCTEFFGGYTGTLRSGERAHSFSLGVNWFF